MRVGSVVCPVFLGLVPGAPHAFSAAHRPFGADHSKTHGQKKWAVVTRPFGREARILTRAQHTNKPSRRLAAVDFHKNLHTPRNGARVPRRGNGTQPGVQGANTH